MNALSIAVFLAASALYLYAMSALGKWLRRRREELSVPSLSVRVPRDERYIATPRPPLDVKNPDVIST